MYTVSALEHLDLPFRHAFDFLIDLLVYIASREEFEYIDSSISK
jgi:hypothetical protein